MGSVSKPSGSSLADEPQHEALAPFATAFAACPYFSFTISRTSRAGPLAFVAVASGAQHPGAQHDPPSLFSWTFWFSIVVSFFRTLARPGRTVGWGLHQRLF